LTDFSVATTVVVTAVVGITVVGITVVAVGTEAAGRQRAGGVMAALLAPTARHLTRQALASASSAGLRWFLRLARNVEPHCNRVRSFALSAARQRSDRAMLVGYARVSTQDQNLELQREALTQAGCQKLFEDKLSGTRAERPGLAKALEMLRKGDTLVVWKLDRLGRSVKQLVDLVSELHKQSIQFKSLTDAIDTGTPSGRFFFHVMASLAEMERELTVERTRAGLAVARLSGRKGGRKPKMTKSKIESAKKLLASGIAPKDVAKNLGVSIPTLYRWVPASGHAEQK
jgi:DNA invertase Pin-like site-specific DNA recombinase